MTTDKPRARASCRAQAASFTCDDPAEGGGAAGPIVVIPCGARKAASAMPAGELYQGSYHRTCRRAADALTAEGGCVLILSARHGLVTLSTHLEPYEQKITDADSVTPQQLRDQAAELGLAMAEHVIVLAGRRYAEAALQVWPHAKTPLAGTRGMGEQMSRLTAIIRSTSIHGSRTDHE